MEVVQDLTCPICLEFYTYPIILPCSHVLCRRPCAENIFEINFIRCPVCRDNCYINGGISSLPRVIPLESIIEKVRAERKKRAGLKKSAIPEINLSLDSEISSGGETFRESVSSASTTCPETSTARNPVSLAVHFDGHEALNNPPVSHTASTENELLGDYQRIMHSLENPPTFCRTAGNNVSVSERIEGSSSCFDNSWTAQVYPSSANRGPQSPFCVTPTNEVTVDLAVESENVLSSPSTSPHHQNSSFTYSSHSWSTLSNESIVPVQRRVSNCHTTDSSQRRVTANVISSLTQVNNCEHVTRDGNTSFSSGDITLCGINESSESVEAIVLKYEIQDQLAKLSDVQCRLLLYLTSYRLNAEEVQNALGRNRAVVTSELDSLVAEIENQRSAMVEGVNAAEREVTEDVDDVTSATEKLLTATQRLVNFADQALSSPPEVLQQTGPAVLEKLTSSVKTCELCLETSQPALRAILSSNRFSVDFRHQRSALQCLTFLNVPRQPVLDLQKCSRGHDTVVLVLARPPLTDIIDSYHIRYCSEEQKYLVPRQPVLDLQKCSRGHDTVVLVLARPSPADIVDSYHIRYCSEEQKYLGIEESVTYKTNCTSNEDPNSARDTGTSHFCWRPPLTFTLIEHLCSSTVYYFRVCAMNGAGSSMYSDLVQCMTLSKEECVVPVPSILESLSAPAPNASAKIVCHAPSTVSPHQGVQHFLLFRPMGVSYVWNGAELQGGKEEHGVSELQSGREYQFVVLACNYRGEGQVSEKLSLMMV
ncbi:E3 ubiquitin-protein ligase midline-1-like [Plakobranchus ocellatus]|uniref:E3 ubiquitin-protein ligase midline-1-like n=1 Tax=Plakobranchus ocellatus TaxID=259542 RepID=A0AAV4B9Q3_9GAST|nr:E3 ubiquitin-protein ligase midline-1-like [Plakobranchus ocellatus]